MKSTITIQQKTLLALAASFALTFHPLAHADFDKGVSAYKNKNYSSALQEFRASAALGDAKSQRKLGVMYYYGEGAPKDQRLAAEWYRKAAEQGDAGAQYNLGVMYHNGQGVSKDQRLAAEWYRKAAEQGNADAQNDLGFMYNDGHGVSKDQRLAAEWYRKAAEQGNTNAQNNLGVCFMHGTCMPKNLVAAYGLYNLAAADGNEMGKQNLTELEAVMSPIDIRKGQNLATKLSIRKNRMAGLDAYVRANPWRESQESLPKRQSTQPTQRSVYPEPVAKNSQRTIPEPKRCRTETRYESRPFNENVCDYNQYGPTNCRNVTTRHDQIATQVEVCDN